MVILWGFNYSFFVDHFEISNGWRFEKITIHLNILKLYLILSGQTRNIIQTCHKYGYFILQDLASVTITCVQCFTQVRQVCRCHQRSPALWHPTDPTPLPYLPVSNKVGMILKWLIYCFFLRVSCQTSSISVKQRRNKLRQCVWD